MGRLLSRYPGMLWLLALGMAINVIGNSFLWPMNTIYMEYELGKSVKIAGLVLMLQAAFNLIGNLLGGAMFDRFGGRKTVIIGICISLVSVLGMATFKSFYAYVLLLMLHGLSNGTVFPSMYAAAKTAWPQGGRSTFNLIYVAQNIGVAVGTALGGLIAEFNFTYVFLGNALTYVIFLSLIIFFLKLPSAPVQSSSVTTKEKKAFKVKLTAVNMPLLLLCVGFALCWLVYVQFQTTFAVHMIDLGFSTSSYSLIWTVNGLLIVLAQPVALWLAKKMPSIKMQIMAGSVIFMIAMISLIGQTAYTAFMVSMIILTLGEMFIWPGVPAAASEMAPEGKTGTYQGIVGSAATFGRMIGPFIGATLFEGFSADVMIVGMVIFLLLSFASFAYYDKTGMKLPLIGKRHKAVEKINS